MQDRWLLLQIFALQIEGNRTRDRGSCSHFLIPGRCPSCGGGLSGSSHSQKHAKVTGNVHCPFGVTAIQSDTLF